MNFLKGKAFLKVKEIKELEVPEIPVTKSGRVTIMKTTRVTVISIVCSRLRKTRKLVLKRELGGRIP
jgi:hypothetical protein